MKFPRLTANFANLADLLVRPSGLNNPLMSARMISAPARRSSDRVDIAFRGNAAAPTALSRSARGFPSPPQDLLNRLCRCRVIPLLIYFVTTLDKNILDFPRNISEFRHEFIAHKKRVDACLPIATDKRIRERAKQISQ